MKRWQRANKGSFSQDPIKAFFHKYIHTIALNDESESACTWLTGRRSLRLKTITGQGRQKESHLGKLLKLNPTTLSGARIFCADVYSQDRNKYQFQLAAANVQSAYDGAVKEAFSIGVRLIRCVAVYRGSIKQRTRDQAPIQVWQQAGKPTRKAINPTVECQLT